MPFPLILARSRRLAGIAILCFVIFYIDILEDKWLRQGWSFSKVLDFRFRNSPGMPTDSRVTSIFENLDAIDGWRVSVENPPRTDIEGMDAERCAALHNAILSHGWVASGRLAADFPRTTWWQAQVTDENVEVLTERLHASVVEFLKRSYDVPEEVHFFYYLPGLNSAQGMLEDWLGHFDEGDSVTLYVSDQTMASKTLGLL